MIERIVEELFNSSLFEDYEKSVEQNGDLNETYYIVTPEKERYVVTMINGEAMSLRKTY